MLTAPSVEGRILGLRPDVQRHLRTAGFRHRSVEFDDHPDRLSESIRVAPCRERDEGNTLHSRLRAQASVHLAPVLGGYRLVRQISGHRTGGRDGSAVENQHVGGDADSVLIAVLLLHGVAEVQGTSAPSGEGRVACLGPDGQRNLGFAGCRHHLVEVDFHLDRLSESVRVTRRRRRSEGDLPHPRRRRDQAAVHLAVALGG